MLQVEKALSEIKLLTETRQQLRVVFSNPISRQYPKKIDLFTNPDSSKLPYATSKIVDNQDFTQQLSSDECYRFVLETWQLYRQVLVTTTSHTYQILHNGKSNTKVKSTKTNSANLVKTQQKHYLIPAESPFLLDLGIADRSGAVKPSMYAKYRQINKFVEILSTTIANLSALSIYDFGCGKGYLTFGLYAYLEQQGKLPKRCVGIDLKQAVIADNLAVAKSNHFDHLDFVHGDINDTVIANCDVLIALHACDIATDIALHKAITSNSKYIFASPCCHKQIRRTMTLPTAFDSITKHGILLERQAELLTDTLRCLLLEQNGYRADIFEFVSTEHTAKNLMIRAVYTGNTKDNANQIQELKSAFGINGEHYLETLLKGK